MDNEVSEKTMENVRKHRQKREEPNYYTTKFFTEYLLVIEMKQITEILMNKLVYLGLSILELSKILMYNCWYDYVKPKYGEKSKLCYMDTDSFIVYIKTAGTYKNIGKYVENRFDTANYELDRPLPKEKNKKVIGLMKDKLGEKVMTNCFGLRAKTSIT